MSEDLNLMNDININNNNEQEKNNDSLELKTEVQDMKLLEGMKRVPQGELRTFMKRVPQGELITLMTRDTEEKVENLQINECIEELGEHRNNRIQLNSPNCGLENNVPIIEGANLKLLITNYRQHYGKNLYYEDIDGRLNIKSDNENIELANFKIIAEKILIKDDGVRQEKLYIVRCILNGNQKEKRISIRSEELINNEWIKQKLGAEYYISSDDIYKKIEILIAEQFRNIMPEIEYMHVGWRNINGRFVYLHGDGAIGAEENDIKGDNDKVIKIDYKLNKIQALEGALNMINISNNPKKTLPLFLYSHLAVMKEVFIQAGIEPKFILWIYGLTGSMKTSISKVFFNIFNRSIKEEITATFKDTITAIEIKAFEYKDSILLVDDFHPTTSTTEKKEMEKMASEILRRYGDGISRSRSTKNLTRQKEFPPRGLCVITGEDKLGGQSTIARYIGIEVNANDFASDKLLYHQRNPSVYSTHIYYFISWIASNFEEIKNFISEKFIFLRDKNLNQFMHKRFVETYTIYQIVNEIFIEYWSDVLFFDKDKKQAIIEEWNNIIYEVIKTHENSNLKEDPAIMYIMAIQELFASNKLKLIRKGDNSMINTKISGCFDDEKYYLLPKIAFAEVKDFWKHLSIEFPVSSDQVNKALDELGIIETRIEGNKKRRTIKLSGHGNDRFLVINIEKMNKLLNPID